MFDLIKLLLLKLKNLFCKQKVTVNKFNNRENYLFNYQEVKNTFEDDLFED